MCADTIKQCRRYSQWSIRRYNRLLSSNQCRHWGEQIYFNVHLVLRVVFSQILPRQLVHSPLTDDIFFFLQNLSRTRNSAHNCTRRVVVCSDTAVKVDVCESLDESKVSEAGAGHKQMGNLIEFNCGIVRMWCLVVGANQQQQKLAL